MSNGSMGRPLDVLFSSTFISTATPARSIRARIRRRSAPACVMVLSFLVRWMALTHDSSQSNTLAVAKRGSNASSFGESFGVSMATITQSSSKDSSRSSDFGRTRRGVDLRGIG